MNRHLATHRAFGVAVIWDAGDDEPAALTATAETVPQIVHYHLHIEPGTDPDIIRRAITQGVPGETEIC